MNEPAVKDRRRHQRLQLDTKVEISDDNSFILKDISPIGAAAISETPVEEMTLVSLRFELRLPELAALELDCRAVVVRCDEVEPGRYELGLYFSDLTPDKTLEIEGFIEAALELD
ncbi:MAG: PilZ domain-containing protein [Planctomycetes bacterium]|nr:PilZ domain-containing protein [Planctomycetota bacterium]